MTKAFARLSEIHGLLETMQRAFGQQGLSATEQELLRALKCLNVDTTESEILYCEKTPSRVNPAANRARLRQLVASQSAGLDVSVKN